MSTLSSATSTVTPGGIVFNLEAKLSRQFTEIFSGILAKLTDARGWAEVTGQR